MVSYWTTIRVLYVLKITWFNLLVTVKGATDPTCIDTCNCCIRQKCHGSGDWWNVCIDGCVDGHEGARCYNLCESNCKSCDGFLIKCLTCYDGFYLANNRCQKCPTYCQSCASYTFCTSCEEGYVNMDGTCQYTPCPVNCKCNTGSSVCIACDNGYYDTATSCANKCPSSCSTCSSLNMCSNCINGFYNGYELDDDTKSLSNSCSYKCRDTCTQCQSYDNCLQCIDGKYGQKCQHNCSFGCRDQKCNVETGNCVCSTNFIGDKCDTCNDGYYGPDCSQVCSTHCQNKKCDRTTGHCSDGCSSKTIIGETCDDCKADMFGELCDTNCPTNCLGMKCDRQNGSCSDGCKENFQSVMCDACEPGKHGTNCELNCSDKCGNTLCSKNNGSCISCYGNFDGNRCDICKPGYHGLSCNDSCSPQCKHTICNIRSGACDNGCINNYSGDKCCVLGGNCIKCSNNLKCQECESGYYGLECKTNCSENCVAGCEISSGACEKCKDGSFGRTCNETCSSLCVESVCNQNSGLCAQGCTSSLSDPVCARFYVKPPDDEPNLIGPIVGGIVGLIALISCIVAIILFKRRQKGKQTDQRNTLCHKTEAADNDKVPEGHVYENFHETNFLEDDEEQNGADVSPTVTVNVDEVEIEDNSQDYYSFEPRVKVDDLFSYVTKRHADSFDNEFQNLAKDLDLAKHCTFAKKSENIGFNRYNGIYPYDHSRVTVPGQPKFFINACYIDGYDKPKAYIASLGPTAKTTHTFSTFWTMVWSEKSDIIVMLTNLREASGMKCEQYWPEVETEAVYGHIKVECRSVEDFAEYTIRTFTIFKGKERRNVQQLHYTAWPDKGVPQEVTSLVEFRQRVKAVPVTLGGPVIVHCSAGVGRTGTYIALDKLTEEGKSQGSVDVFSCVNKMREQRVNMVQTAEQYRFLYKAVVHSLSFGCETLTAEEIPGLVYNTNTKTFSDMFKTLGQVIDTEKQEVEDDREKNKTRYKDKNRRHSDIPANQSRVRLYLAREGGDHDYINAVFINSFKMKNLFIAAQSPLPGTVEDFVCMVYQQNASCVVALEDSHNQSHDLGIYLPADNETYTCGDFTVTSSKCDTKQQYILKKLSIQNTKKRTEKMVYHFQYTKWAHPKKVPDRVEDFVNFVKDVEKNTDRTTEDTPHVVVHCLNGYERTGLFCVVYKLLEKLEAERQVSVVNTVRKIRTHRKQSITSMEQLKFCYQCISAYLDIFNTYSNVAS